MGNSPLVTYTNISPNKTIMGDKVNDTISIHCVVGQFTAKQILDMDHFVQYSPRYGSSCNYAVGCDGSIGLGVEEKHRSWCTSSRANDSRAITIEVASDKTHPYAVTDAAYHSLINLLVDICKRNNIPELRWKADKSLIGQVDKQNMTVHRWFANKACPGDFLYYRMGKIAAEVNARLKEEDEDMDLAKFTDLIREYRDTLQDNDSSKYSAEARKWAVDAKLIQGNGTDQNGEPNCMWEDFMTREQFVTVLYRFAKHAGLI